MYVINYMILIQAFTYCICTLYVSGGHYAVEEHTPFYSLAMNDKHFLACSFNLIIILRLVLIVSKDLLDQL